jgi:transcriptional regulator with XRE-family HTH domain
MESYKTSGRRAYPASVVDRLIDGGNPVKVMREWRGLTQAALATKTGLSKAVISHIETGERGGGVKTLGKIAHALNVPMDVLVTKRTA